MQIKNKKILLTGGAGGLGTGIASGLAEAGARVVVLDIDTDAGTSLVKRLNEIQPESATFVPCDLSEGIATKQVLEKLVAEEEGIDILINNAATYPAKPFEEFSLEEYQFVQRVNLEAAFVCTQALLPQMKAQQWGRIINVSSITFYGGWEHLAPYVMTKGGIVGFTRALAREMGPFGITVNAISPGAFPTAAEEIHPDPEAYKKFVLEHQALKRRGTPEDVSNLVQFLASDASGFITGQTINLDGGWVMN